MTANITVMTLQMVPIPTHVHAEMSDSTIFRQYTSQGLSTPETVQKQIVVHENVSTFDR